MLGEDDNLKKDKLFKEFSDLLSEIVRVLDSIEVKLTFVHQFFPAGKFVSFWNFYNRVHEENTKNPNEKSASSLIKRFFARQVIPTIPAHD